MKQKRKGTETDVRTYHYTIVNYLPKILRDGEIKLATAGCYKIREHAAWVSTNEFWEESANKMYLSADGTIHFGDIESTHRVGGGLARIEVNPKAAPFDWKHYAKKSKTSGAMRRGLEATAKQSGSKPSEWYASFKPIQRKDWIKIEVFDWDEQCWVPYHQESDIKPVSNDKEEGELGNCYENSYDVILHRQINGVPLESLGIDRENLFLCHGTVRASELSVPRHGHAWLEYGDKVIDVSGNEKVLVVPKEVYYSLGNVKEACTYTVKDVCQMTLKHGHKGPWQ